MQCILQTIQVATLVLKPEFIRYNISTIAIWWAYDIQALSAFQSLSLGRVFFSDTLMLESRSAVLLMVLGTDTYSSSRLPLYKSIICRNRTGVNLHVISSRHTNMLLWLEIYALYHHNRHHNGKTIICYTSKTKFSKYNCANKASTVCSLSILHCYVKYQIP